MANEGIWFLSNIQKFRLAGSWPIYVPSDTTSVFGWFGGGGISPGATPTATVDRIDYANDSVNADGRCSLSLAREYPATVSNGAFGWFAGGGSSSNIVDRMAFANDTANAIDRCDLVSGVYATSGVNNGLNGWFAGGQSPSFAPSNVTNAISRLIFANDTTDTSNRSILTLARSAIAGVSNGTNGWFAGGNSPALTPSNQTNVIDRMVFATDTVNATDRCDLPGIDEQLASVANASFGWFAGGIVGPGTSVSRIDFGNDVSNAVNRCNLSVARFRMSGTTNGTYGWFGGGLTPSVVSVNVVDRITLANDTVNAIDRCDLAQGRAGAGSHANSSAAF